MGSIFKKTITRPMPLDAEIIERKGERLARWRIRGKVRTAPITTGEDGSIRVVTESETYYAKFRNGEGHLDVVATKCRDEQAARRVLSELERKAELVRSGVISAAEDRISSHQHIGLAEHVEAYVESLRAADRSVVHRENTRRALERVNQDCSFGRLTDLDRETVERWLSEQGDKGMSARTRNAYRNAIVAFGNWCVANFRLVANPFTRLPKANERANRIRERRALTADELRRLLEVARSRPLIEAQTVRRGTRKGELGVGLRPETITRLQRIGRERALIYKTLVLSGLRKNELASLSVAKMYLDCEQAYAVLDAADEKNREGSIIPLRKDLASDLQSWLAEKLVEMQSAARLRVGEPHPTRLPPESKVFDVPKGLLRILNRDLKLANIAKRDERGRTVDLHALRHTFGTLLSKGGVSPRTAQAAMRHSDIRLTMNTYTDPKLLDVAGAMDSLPDLPLSVPTPTNETARLTGTDGCAVAPIVAPTWCNRSQTQSNVVKSEGMSASEHRGASVAATSMPVKTKEPLTIPVSGSLVSGWRDLNPRPLEPHSSALAKLRHSPS